MNFKYCHINIKNAVIALILILTVSGCGGSRKTAPKTGNQDTGITEKTYKGPVEVTASVNKKRITLADSLEYMLTIKCEKGYNAQLPEFNEKLFGGFAVKDRITLAKEYPDTQTVVLKEKYLLDPFLSGVYTISPLEIKFYSDTDTQIYTVESKSLEITVDSLTDTAGQIPAFRDAVSPVELKRNYKKTMIIAVSIIIGLLIIGGCYYIWRRRKSKNKVATVILPADEIAYIKLRELISLKLVEQNQIKEFYFRLSLILREYLENRFALRAQEQTTEEFIYDIISRQMFVGDEQSILKNFMEHCDLVKFAKYSATADEIQKSFDFVKEFIEKTKLKK